LEGKNEQTWRISASCNLKREGGGKKPLPPKTDGGGKRRKWRHVGGEKKKKGEGEGHFYFPIARSKGKKRERESVPGLQLMRVGKGEPSQQGEGRRGTQPRGAFQPSCIAGGGKKGRTGGKKKESGGRRSVGSWSKWKALRKNENVDGGH